MTDLLVIFDVDGTLVDSEYLCCQGLADLIPVVHESVDELVLLYRGRRLLDIFADIEKNKKVILANDFEQQYRARVAELFTTHLQSFPGVAAMLATLPFPCCIASNGPIHKIRHALSVTGLSHFFADRLYSSFSVGAWKPDPAVFLYAAEEMDFLPQHCVVIEDSLVGIQAAQAANMQSLRFVSNQPINQQENCFNHMSQLPALLKQLAASL